MSERESIESMRLFKPRVAMVLGWTTLASLVVLGLFGLWGAPPARVAYRQPGGSATVLTSAPVVRGVA